MLDSSRDAGRIGAYYQALDALSTSEVGIAQDRLVELAIGESPGVVRTLRTVLALLNAGREDEAEHSLVRLLAGSIDPGASAALLHVTLAAAAIGRGDVPRAIHQVEHAAALTGAADPLLDQARAKLESGAGADALVLLRAAATQMGRRATLLRFPVARQPARFDEFDGVVGVTLLLDEEWRAHLGGRAEAAAGMLIRRVADAFAGTPIAVRLIEVRSWESPEATTLEDLLGAVVRSARDSGPGGVAVGLTAADYGGRGDGVQSRNLHAAVVRHDHAAHEKEVRVLVHELGHQLGLRHEDGGYMQAVGFPDDPGWSPCQIDALTALVRMSDG